MLSRRASIIVCALLTAPLAAGQELERLDLERLYSLPRIIGTEPTDVVWARDSSRFAFLWNDEGTNFRDVWVGTTEGASTVRVTHFPRPAVPAGTDVDALRVQQRAEQNPGATAVDWFADNRRLLVTFAGALYAVPADGGEAVDLGLAARPLGFSPDGGHLAVVREGDVWLVAVTERGLGAARRITDLSATGQRVARVHWSPDGRRLALVLRDGSGVRERLFPDYLGDETTVASVPRALPGEEPGRTRLALLDVEGGGMRPLLADHDDTDLLFTVEWSPSGDRLLVDKSDLYVKDRRVLLVDAASGAVALAHREREPDNVMAFWSAAWAPDGEAVYVVSDRDDYYHLYRVAPGSEPVAVTSGAWAVERFGVTDQGLYFVANREHPAERHVYRVGFGSENVERVSNLAGTHAPTVSPDGRWAAVHFSSDQQPAELYLNRLDQLGEVRLTESPLPEFAQRRWIVPEYVTFPSHVDGVTLHGRLMLPPDFDPGRRYPAIIGSIYSNTLRNQWGGRNAHPLWGLDQYLLQQGYVLMNINIRGSWGHGRAFRRRLKGDYGGIDTEDIYSGVRYLESLGTIDMERVGLWGSSYGGLMTAMSLFKRPGVFAAGVAGAPATNVWHATTGEMRVMGRPQDEPDAYVRSSAVTHAAGLEDPLMIIHGMRDRIVMFKDSLTLHEHLMLHGKGHLVEFVPLPNSPHGWDTVDLYQTRYALRKLVDHFDRYLRSSS